MTRPPAQLHGLHLHVDCASGAAGDMMLGALIDLGVPVGVIGDALDAIGAGRDRLQVARVVKRGIAAVDVKVDTRGELAGAERHVHGTRPPAHGHAQGDRAGQHAGDRGHGHGHGHGHDHGHGHGYAVDRPSPSVSAALAGVATGGPSSPSLGAPLRGVPTGDHRHDHDHGHDHDHAHQHDDPPAHDHAHYHYARIRQRITEAPLTAGTRRRALDIFDRIARAEARLHGTTVDSVTFHEVGAIDSVVDVVGTAAALDWLAPARVSCTSVAMGHGTIVCAHGVLPVPAPAALEILREAGGIMADGGLARELCTPTGAAILAGTVTAWTAAPTGRPIAVGWGAGDAELRDRANALRATVIDPGPAAAGALDGTAEGEIVWQVDANIDDMSPELCGPASEAVFAAGALDVWWTPITMKKGRPALMISALAVTAARAAVTAAILRETTTIGVRYAARARTVLARTIREVATPYGPIAVKVAADGDTVMNVAPELDVCVAAARRCGVPVKLVFAAALAAFESAR